LSDEEREIERLLASLPVRESRLNRDRTTFLAGRASGLVLKQLQLQPRTAGRWIWPGATIRSAAAGLLIGLLIAQQGPVAGVHERDAARAIVAPGAKPNAPEAIGSHNLPSTFLARLTGSREREDAAIDRSDSFLALRAQLFGGAGGAASFVEDKQLALASIRAAAARAERRGTPVSYRDFIGHLPGEEDRPRL
jgi:hypothetical protein